MNKKGFTLTELIAILVVISIVALIAVPAVVNSIKNNNHDSYNGVINDIILASETYAANMGASIVQISVETLKQAGYLPVELKNPIDNSSFNGCVYVVNGDSIYKEETCSTIILNVDGVRTYKDSILNGLDPVLGTGLIPVVIADDGTVTKASLSSEWYNYAEKKWANAVVLKGGDMYSEGQTIPENDIAAYFVWIPKFKYKLFDMGNYTTYSGTSKPATSIAHTIDIVFDPVNTVDSDTSCSTPLASGASGNCAVGKYMTHPSFITLGVNGYWVGKYETGYDGATSTSAAKVNASTPEKVVVKPNVYSWRNNTVGNMFTTAYNYQRSLDSHMMKNTEWGAVAYLSLSNYGIGTEVRINNNSQYVTGCAATVAATNYVGRSQSDHSEGYYAGCENTYNSSIGQLASTTGNITGVYDMSGGAWEYMSSYISENVGSSGLTVASYDTKYFDVYNSSSAWRTYNYRILGDATGELGPFYYYQDSDNNQRDHNSWFSDLSSFVDSSYPWFLRGGNYSAGVVAGQLSFRRATGAVNSAFGFRLVLAPGGGVNDHQYGLGTTWNFDYTGSAQEFNVPENGTYKVELWGAQGGTTITYGILGGLGGYTAGNIDIDRGDKLYVYVGEQGAATPVGTASFTNGGFNGGGDSGGQSCCNRSYGTGGGATDIRLVGGTWNNFDSLKSRIMVAGAGGGAFTESGTINDVGGAGGGLNGQNGYATYDGGSYCYGEGATQIFGGKITTNCAYAANLDVVGGTITGGFGTGGTTGGSATGGGSGYYGGSRSGHVASAGGGSSFISGYSGCNAIAESSTSSSITHTNQPNHYSGKVFTNGVMIDGAGCNWSTGSAANCGTNQPQPNGTNAVGHSGNGYAKITLISY